ncbi:MAG TPA: adenosine kinase, partial [Pseudomonadales bacterium]|nr:adenosine kinase [Pseudomonadales bacterium]
KFGGKSFYSCRVAHDEIGDYFLQDLKDAGIDTNLSAVREKGTSGTCLVLVTPDAERTMNTFLGISSEVCFADVNEEALINSDYFYIEGYLVTSPSAKDAVIKSKAIAEKNGVKTAISLSDPNMVKFFHQGLLEMIGGGVDLLFCNEAEALGWAHTESLPEAILELKKIAKQFVITLGSKGALLFDGKQEINVPAFPVKAVDSNGAGDIFAGAFLYGITNGLDFATAGRLASHSAATLITHFGARLPKDSYAPLLSIVG